jgi:hypothetical protein
LARQTIAFATIGEEVAEHTSQVLQQTNIQILQALLKKGMNLETRSPESRHYWSALKLSNRLEYIFHCLLQVEGLGLAKCCGAWRYCFILF